MLRYKVITSPVIYPIDATDATVKQHLRLSGTDADDLLTEYIKASVEDIERYIGYPLMTQVIEVKLTDYPEKEQILTGNVNDIISYTYYDGTDTIEVTGAAATGLQIDKYGLLSYVINRDWVDGTEFKFKCNAGYTVATCPANLIQACRLLVMSKYEDREGKEPMPETVSNILDLHLLY